MYRVGWNMMYGNPQAVIAGLPQDDPAYVETTRCCCTGSWILHRQRPFRTSSR